MIEHVRTMGFKGFDLDEDVPEKVIYTGKNKTGKSTRAGAIAIAIFGYIPFSTAGKRPGDVLDSFGDESLIAAVTIGGTEFARKFTRNAAGKVSQVMQIDQKRASAENFAILLNKAGAPKIADIAEFMKQSSAKKVDTLFELFPNDALASIDIDIEKAKEDVSRLEKKKTGAESTVVRLTNSKQQYQTPAGTIASVQDEINQVETQIVELSEQIKQAEIEEARIEAEEKGKQLEKERIEKEAEDKYFEADPIETEIQNGEQQIADFKANSGFSENQDILGNDSERKTCQTPDCNNPVEKVSEAGDGICTKCLDFIYHHNPRQAVKFYDAVKSGEIQEPSLPDPETELQTNIRNILVDTAYKSIQKIIDALVGSGCGTCAALIVAKQELKKFKEVS